MSERKRKLGNVSSPNEDALNETQMAHKSLRLQFYDDTSSGEEETGNLLSQSIKVFNDPVHGHIELHPLCTKIVDTPQFQRLRDIKQLGACYLVFPGASHNRFEHSIGVCYLAGKICQTLVKKQPSLNITDTDVLCVKIAGLCHDLGHGPFSHLFDGIFLPLVGNEKKWKHEQGSVAMLDYLIKENDLWPVFEDWGLTQRDITFIKEMIAGCDAKSDDSWPFQGRGRDKAYLYQIVANKKTGVDVDKWDYFARDCYHLGIPNNFDYRRYMKFARVVHCNGEMQICTRDKEVGTLYDMFHTRNSLHRKAYQHKTCKLLDMMFSEALVAANPFVEIPSKNGKKKISESINDMAAYTNLNDSIFHTISSSDNPRLSKAKSILHRIKKRDLYMFIGQTIIKYNLGDTETEFRDAIISSDSELNREDFIVHIINFDYGMKDQNPIDHVRFYHKNDPNFAIGIRKDQVSQMLPETFAEKHLRFYCKKKDAKILEEGNRCFKKWCKEFQQTTPRINSSYSELTPFKKAKIEEDCKSNVKPSKPNFDK
eukprot:gene18822-20718_t